MSGMREKLESSYSVKQMCKLAWERKNVVCFMVWHENRTHHKYTLFSLAKKLSYVMDPMGHNRTECG